MVQHRKTLSNLCSCNTFPGLLVYLSILHFERYRKIMFEYSVGSKFSGYPSTIQDFPFWDGIPFVLGSLFSTSISSPTNPVEVPPQNVRSRGEIIKTRTWRVSMYPKLIQIIGKSPFKWTSKDIATMPSSTFFSK